MQIDRIPPDRGPIYHSTTTVIVPNTADDADFHDDIVREFETALIGHGHVVSNPMRPYEITIVNVKSNFPARLVKDVGFLRAAYETRVQRTDSKRARFELHTEGDGATWPSLVPSA